MSSSWPISSIALVYAMVAEWLWRGQTVGKRLLGLRVVDAHGLRLEPSQVIVRNLLAIPGCLARSLPGRRDRLRLEPASPAAGGSCGRNRRGADVPLREAESGSASGREVQFSCGIAPSGRAPAPKAGSRDRAYRARSAASRDQLEPSARIELFGQLAGHFRALVPYPPEIAEQIADEQYVRDVVEILYRPAGPSLKSSSIPTPVKPRVHQPYWPFVDQDLSPLFHSRCL